MMIKNILVPLDGSPLAARALPYAAALARAAGGRLILIRAIDVTASSGSRPKDEHDARSGLDAAAAMLRDGGVEAEPYLCYIYSEKVGAAIVRITREMAADLVVMSTHGRTSLGRFIHGSVADAVLGETEVPVLVIPSACERPWPTGHKPRLLVPLDGSDLSAEALGPAAELADLLGADLVLLRVVLPSPYIEGYYYKEVDEELEMADVSSALEAAAKRLTTSERKVEVCTALGYPGVQIRRIARDEGIDVIAMATRGRGGLARLVMGSVATGTLQHAGLPILLVRPTTLRRAAWTGQPSERTTC